MTKVFERAEHGQSATLTLIPVAELSFLSRRLEIGNARRVLVDGPEYLARRSLRARGRACISGNAARHLGPLRHGR